jgi:RimJ/RimL family protein N-acetyltransferase
MKLFSHEVAQKHWAMIDYKKNISLIGLVQIGGHKEIIAIGSYAMEEPRLAEVAFVVREDFQGMGIASYLLDSLKAIAEKNGYNGFSASVMRQNTAMIRVFKKRFPNARTVGSGGAEVTLVMDFSDTADPS